MLNRKKLYVKIITKIKNKINKHRKRNFITSSEIKSIESLIKIYFLILIVLMYLIDIRIGISLSLLTFVWFLVTLSKKNYSYNILFNKILNKRKIKEGIVYVNKKNASFYNIASDYYYIDFLEINNITLMTDEELTSEILTKKTEQKLLEKEEKMERELEELKSQIKKKK